MRFDLAIVGDGVFAAICALRMACAIEPDRILFLCEESVVGGNCPELLLPGLLEPAVRDFLEEYRVLEWDRGIIAGSGGRREVRETIWMVDPMQVFAHFSDRLAGAKVLCGVRGTHAIEGYVIVDGDILPCRNQLDLRPALLRATHEGVMDARAFDEPVCPVLLDLTLDPVRQIIPIDAERVLVNRLEAVPFGSLDAAADLNEAFPIHRALNSLFVHDR